MTHCFVWMSKNNSLYKCYAHNTLLLQIKVILCVGRECVRMYRMRNAGNTHGDTMGKLPD